MTCEHKWTKTSLVMVRVYRDGDEHSCRVVAEMCQSCKEYRISDAELDRYVTVTSKARKEANDELRHARGSRGGAKSAGTGRKRRGASRNS